MKAIVFDRYGSLDNLGLRDIAKPAISQDEVLVRVHAAGVHVGDCLGVKGKPFAVRSVSYTHLDVYKRQAYAVSPALGQ